ncbi:hypothetical protein JOF29_007945 [Kribbella aluminosa]|uniref:Uncharacterized protein n=1 Tax=Kribbella aluminosa TaxID=416017 RepID=A0ABS4UYW7_9ACTN|nr:hypothetical protein [Kribbella aluminosa]MBP2356835.1 hypothetical protein [Kribbella aluminosa]
MPPGEKKDGRPDAKEVAAPTRAATTSGPDGKLKSTVTPPWEPSAWFRGQIVRVATRTRLVALPYDGTTVVVVALRHAQPGSREDRTCDRCREYVPPMSAKFFCGAQHFRISGHVCGVMTFGLCDRCRRLEGLTMGQVTP